LHRSKEPRKKIAEFAQLAKGDTLKYFHWKNCGHCTSFNPEWAKFKSEYTGHIKLKKLEKDDKDESGTCVEQMKKMGASAFPTIVMLDAAGNKITDFTGERTKQNLLEFCRKHE